MPMNKQKVLVRFGIMVLILFSILAIAYSYLAFMPTGYAGFEKSIPRERVAGVMNPRLQPAAPDVVTTEPASGSVMNYNSVPSEQRGAVHKLDFYEELVSYNSGPVRNSRTESLNNLIGYGIHMYAFSRTDVLGSIELADQSMTTGTSVLAMLTPDQRDKLIHSAKWGLTIRSAGERYEPIQAVEPMNRYLDCFEEFLLRPQWDVATPTQPIFNWPNDLRVLQCKALMVVMRASLAGNNERALKLLERYFEAVRLLEIYYRTNPCITQRSTATNMATFWLNLAQLPGLKDGYLDRAIKLWEKSQPTQEEIKLLQQVRAINLRNEIARVIENREYTLKQGTWHFFGSGRPERIVNTALQPILLRQLDLMTASQFKPDSSYESHARRFHILKEFMNISALGGVGVPVGADDYVPNPTPFDFGFYRARNFDPRDVIEIERFPYLTDQRPESPSGQFHTKHGHYPDTEAEVNEVVQQPGNEKLKYFVQRIGPQKLIVCAEQRNHLDAQMRPTSTVYVFAYRADALIRDEVRKLVEARNNGI